MSLTGLLTRDVTIVRAGRTTSRYSDDIADWDAATTTDTKGWLAQRSAAETIAAGRDANITTWVLYLPAGTDITSADRVTIDGDTFDVDGPPKPARTPAGEHHIEATLRLVAG